MCCVGGLVVGAAAQLEEKTFTLTPPVPSLWWPPFYNDWCPPPFDPWISRCRGPADVVLTVGDLKGSQTAANTPVVTEVEFVPNTVPAAETTDATVTLPVKVALDRKGMDVVQLEVRVLHPLTSYQYETVYAVPVGQRQQNEHTLTFTDLPSGHFGWGNDTVNVQAVVEDAQQVQRVSDWWPRLRIHP